MTFKLIDLTHKIEEDIPLFPGDPHVKIEKVKWIDKDGFNLNSILIGEHTGTHIGTPIHFLKDGFSVSEIPEDLLFIKSILIDIERKSNLKRDYLLNICDVKMWESTYGKIRERCVLIRTGWDRLWKKRVYLGIDEKGIMHFPGIKPSAVELLVSRGVKIVGIDTHGIDGGMDRKFKSNKILFKNGGIHIENLTNLDKLPPRNFYIVLGALKIKNGGGSPARIFALTKIDI